MRWYNVRAIYLHGRDADGGVFEERLVLFQAADFERAMALAEAESREYLAINAGFMRVGNWAAFSLHREAEHLHNVEVWSVLSESTAEAADYYRLRYHAHELRPDEDDVEPSAGARNAG